MKFRIRHKSKSLLINILILIILAVFLFWRCSTLLQNGTSSFSVEKTFETSVFGMGLPLKISHSGPWELGIAFQPKKNCKIIGIRIKNPELGKKLVSFWDSETRQLISSYNLTISNLGDYNYFNIEIPLQKNKTYALSINCDSYYFHKLPFDHLPMQNENIILMHSVYTHGSWHKYPSNHENSLVHGLIDIDIKYNIN